MLKSASPGSELFVKTLYDAIGRVLKSYQAYYNGTGSDDPTSVAANVVMSQSETLYDDAGRVLMTTGRERYHDASTSAQGALDLLVNLSLARVTYTTNWYDKIGRSTDTANYGTNGGLLLTRPSLPPSSSDDILVYKTQYNYKGEVYLLRAELWPHF